LKIFNEIRDNLPAPVLSGSGISVGHVVATCHEMSIDDALGTLETDGLNHKNLDDVLVYCAERRCQDDGATCPGCRLRLRMQGIDTMDQFIDGFTQITLGDDGPVIRGHGTSSRHFKSMDELIRTWEGEEYWYWARRVLRKLRHGVRRANVKGEPFAQDGQTPAIILVKPQLADNIGMCARAMANFGMDSLKIINPRDGWPIERVRVAASGANYVIDDAEVFENVEDAVCDLNWLCATTARQRDLSKPVMTPAEAIAEMSLRISLGQKCGILFGPEASGLSSEDLETADALVMIPVNNAFASLNLAQAVLIMGYCWMLTREEKSLGRVTQNEKPVKTGSYRRADIPATKQELIGFFEHLEAELDARGFFNPSHRRPAVVHNLRTLFTRSQASAQEVRSLRGIVATLTRSKGSTHKSKE